MQCQVRVTTIIIGLSISSRFYIEAGPKIWWKELLKYYHVSIVVFKKEIIKNHFNTMRMTSMNNMNYLIMMIKKEICTLELKLKILQRVKLCSKVLIVWRKILILTVSPIRRLTARLSKNWKKSTSHFINDYFIFRGGRLKGWHLIMRLMVALIVVKNWLQVSKNRRIVHLSLIQRSPNLKLIQMGANLSLMEMNAKNQVENQKFFKILLKKSKVLGRP